MKNNATVLALYLVFVAILISGCASNDGAYQTRNERIEAIENKFEPAAGTPHNQEDLEEIHLSLSSAIARGLKENMDLRVSALEVLSAEDTLDLERLAAFPNLIWTGTYNGRSNEGASSSRSFLTGNQSLEPSVSSDQYGYTVDLDMRWNVIDVATAVYNSKIAGNAMLAAQARHRKLAGDIMRDISAAYWRAWLAQENRDALKNALDQAEKQLSNIRAARAQDLLFIEEAARNEAELLQEIGNAQGVLEQMDLAAAELKGLLSLPADIRLTLQQPDNTLMREMASVLSRDLDTLEYQALENRPEIEEALLNIDSGSKEMRREIVRTIPGAEIFVGYNKDSNGFLRDPEWLNFSASVAQNIVSVLTLPKRYKAAKNRKTMQEQRLLALSTAIVTQVHLARHRLDVLRDIAKSAKAEAEAMKNLSFTAQEKHKAGFSSGQQNIIAQIRARTAALMAGLAESELHDAAISMALTLGQNPAPMHEREAM